MGESGALPRIASAAFSATMIVGAFILPFGTWTGEVGDKDQMDLMRSPLDNKVYFAGASLQRHGQDGTVHGAIMSGYDVVRDLLEAHSD